MIDIQQLIEADKELLLTLNGSSSLFWDGFMWTVSGTKIWIPVGAMLLYIIFKNTKFTQGLLILVMLVLTVTLADQFSLGLCKPLFMRFRPAQDPEIMYMVNVVNGYRGGAYGFISSHAANTFAVATFVALLIRNCWMTVIMYIWALIPSFSRIYLGVHYPGDIICGAVAGCVIASLVYWLYAFIEKKYFDQAQYVSGQYTITGFEISDIKVFHTVLLLTYFYAVVAALVVCKSFYF